MTGQSWGTRLGVGFVRMYQMVISPLSPPSCKYYPTCSSYAIGALNVHGLMKGTLLTLARLARCNPLSRGGIDHVPRPGEWRGIHEVLDPEEQAHTMSRTLPLNREEATAQ